MLIVWFIMNYYDLLCFIMLLHVIPWMTGATEESLSEARRVIGTSLRHACCTVHFCNRHKTPLKNSVIHTVLIWSTGSLSKHVLLGFVKQLGFECDNFHRSLSKDGVLVSIFLFSFRCTSSVLSKLQRELEASKLGFVICHSDEKLKHA